MCTGGGWVGRIVMCVCVFVYRGQQDSLFSFPTVVSSHAPLLIIAADTPPVLGQHGLCWYRIHSHTWTHTDIFTHTHKLSRSREEQRAWMSHYCLHRKLYLRGRGWMYKSESDSEDRARAYAVCHECVFVLAPVKKQKLNCWILTVTFIL